MTLTAATGLRNLLRVGDLQPRELHALLDLAARMKCEPTGWLDALGGQALISRFEKPSTRTRVSFAAAAWRLGMQPLVLRPDELQLGRPANRGEEVDAEVIDGSQPAVWDQAENRMHTEQALLHALLTGDWHGHSR